MSGIPLFRRRLHLWGGAILLLLILMVVTASAQQLSAYFALFFIEAGLQIWLAFAGNRMAARNYIEQGWTVLTPEADDVQYALSKWRLGQPVTTA